jgi:predicted  nucleic acid-binding Zn-ribbon protein
VIILGDNLSKKGVVVLEEKEVHLIKQVSKQLGLTYKEFGEKIGYTEGNLKKAVHDNRTTEQLKKAIELYLRTLQLEEQLHEVEEIKKQARTFLEFISK